jgi:glycosyltransferase involved in cell wall biosynthesis
LLLVASSNRRRGAEVFSENLREGLVEHGWDVDAVSLTSSGDDAVATLDPISDSEPGELRRLSPGVLLALRRRVARFQPDILLAGGGATLRYGALATLGRPASLAYVGIGEPEYWLRSDIARTINRWLLRRAAVVLAVSRMTADQLRALEPSIGDRVFHAPTGVPDQFFEIDGRADTSNGPLRVLVIGSLSREKDPAMALQATAALPHAVLRFVGDGPLAGELAQQADELGVAERVEFSGSTLDVKPHLRWAQVLVLTSRTEGLPGVVLEAGAAGVPCVAVDVGGVSEAIRSGMTGIVVDRDLQEVVGALGSLDRDRELLGRMGTEAREFVAAAYSMTAAVERYVSILGGILP